MSLAKPHNGFPCRPWWWWTPHELTTPLPLHICLPLCWFVDTDISS